MDDDVIDGEIIESKRNSSSKPSDRKREGDRTIRIPKSDQDVSARPTDLDSEVAASAASNAPGDPDFSPLLRAHAEEFNRRYEAMTKAYEQALFGEMADALSRIGVVEEPPSGKKPLARRLASTCGEALIQAGQRLVGAAESGHSKLKTIEPLSPLDVDGPQVIVLTNEGDQDDRSGK